MSDQTWSPQAEAYAREAGWHPDRRVDITAWVAELGEDNRFQPHDAAADFLTEFGGLDIPDPGRPGVDFGPVALHLDPRRCRGQRRLFTAAEDKLQARLYPLGEAGDADASLAIDEHAVVYLLFGGQHRRIGVGRQAFANLLEGRYG